MSLTSPGGGGRPLLSVIIPTFNRADLVCRAIDSVLAQDYEPIELIVVDDGSTDATVKVLLQYADKIILIQQPNRGRAAARNTGLAACSGQLVVFLDSDDEFLAGHARSLVQALEGRPAAGMACTGAAHFDDLKNRVIDVIPAPDTSKDTFFVKLARRNYMAVQCVIVRRSILERVGGFNEDPELAGHEDWELWVRCLSESSMTALRSVSALVHFHSANTIDNAVAMERSIKSASLAILSAPGNRQKLLPFRRSIAASMWAGIAHAHLLNGNARTARSRLIQGIREDEGIWMEPAWLTACLKVLMGPRLFRRLRLIRGKLRVHRMKALVREKACAPPAASARR